MNPMFFIESHRIKAVSFLIMMSAAMLPGPSAKAGGPMYNTPDKDVRTIKRIVGGCDADDSYVAIFSNGRENRTPIQCDYGMILELANSNWLINFAYGKDVISFGGVYNTKEKDIDVDQFWPGPSPVDAVNRVAINGLIDKNLDSKCFHETGYIACGAMYKDKNNSFFYSLKINYEKLVDVTEQTKGLRERNYK
jgi:hypothetical protein